MLIFPKIVIKDGESLHQFQNIIGSAIASPAEIATQLVKAGFSWLYIQSLDPEIDAQCLETVAQIIDAVDVPVAFEGAIQDISSVDRLMGEGLSRLTLNNLALIDHGFIQQACSLYPDQIAVHLHANADKLDVAQKGNVTQFDLHKIAASIGEYGAYAILYSETSDQQTGEIEKPGLDMRACCTLAQKTTCPVFYAGKLNHMEDLLSIARETESGIAGALLGEGLYSGQISAADALQIAAGLSLYQQKSNDN